MPNESYDGVASGNMSDGQLLYGPAKPGSDIEAASIASGIPAASLDIYYDDDSAEKNAHKHSGHETSGKP